MVSLDETEFEYDHAFATDLMGTHVIAGITRRARTGEVVGYEQHHGPIVRVDADEGIVIRHAPSGDEFTLPPCTSVFKAADPGQYRLKGSGELVTDPDWLAAWSVYPPEAGR